MFEKWGHDFRPDYKFLGAMKGMFPEVGWNEEKQSKGKKSWGGGGSWMGKSIFGQEEANLDGEGKSRMGMGLEKKQHLNWKSNIGIGKVKLEVEKQLGKWKSLKKK